MRRDRKPLPGKLGMTVVFVVASVLAADGIPRIQYRRAGKLAVLANKKINESSGLACGRRNDGVFWTHNDSGGKPRLFVTNLKGEDLATFDIAGAAARDWEDIASVRMGNRDLLMIADTGNNLNLAMPGRVYIVAEPKLDTNKRKVKGKLKCIQCIRFRLEDGWFDSESIGVDPVRKQIYFVTKPRKKGQQSTVYELPWPQEPSKKVLVAKRLTVLEGVNKATAMDISPDGLRAVVLTYGNAYEYVRGKDETWARGFARPPRVIVMPSRSQGESICYGADGKTLYLTSENLPTPLWQVRVRAPAKRP
jgi:hypothetical protein